MPEPLPDIENVGNTFTSELMRQLHVLIEKRVPVAHHQYIIATPDARQKPGIVKPRQIIERRVQIGVLIIEAVEKLRAEYSNAPDMETA